MHAEPTKVCNENERNKQEKENNMCVKMLLMEGGAL